MEADVDFWERLEQLVRDCKLVIDRPARSCHPHWPDLIYPYDYGYLEGSTAADGGGIDVWRGSMPDKQVTGLICTVDSRKRDAEIKILIGCTPEEMRMILKTHNHGMMSGLLIERSAGGVARMPNH